MAITTKSELLDTAKTWLVRPGDTIIDPFLPDWLMLTEQRFNRERIIRAMETVGDFTLSAASATPGRIPLPTDFLQCRNIRLILTTPVALEQVSAEMFTRSLADDVATGQPTLYAVIGQELNFWKKVDQDYNGEIVYWAKIPALTDAAPTNWLLANAPDVYLFGVLVEASAHLEDPDQLVKWETRYQAAIKSLIESDSRGNESASPDKARYGSRGGYGGAPTYGGIATPAIPAKVA